VIVSVWYRERIDAAERAGQKHDVMHGKDKEDGRGRTVDYVSIANSSTGTIGWKEGTACSTRGRLRSSSLQRVDEQRHIEQETTETHRSSSSSSSSSRFLRALLGPAGYVATALFARYIASYSLICVKKPPLGDIQYRRFWTI